MKNMMKQVCNFLKSYVKYEVLGVIFTIIYTLAVFLSPLISQYLIDKVMPTSSLHILYQGLIVFCIICLLQPVFGFIKDKIFLHITENITYDIRKCLFDKIINADMKFFDEVKTGELVSIIMNDGRGASDFISKIFAKILKNIIMILMIIVGMFCISINITLIVIGVFLLFYLVSLLFGNKLRKISKNIQENYDYICTIVNQTSQSIVTLKSYNNQEYMKNKYQDIITKMRKDNITIDTLSVFINNFSTAMTVICLGVVYGMGTMQVMEGNLTLGSVIALGLYFQLLEQPVFELMNIGINTNITIPIFERLTNYLNLQEEKVGECEGKLNDISIKVNHLSFSYDKNKPILKDISCQLPSCGVVQISGESGSGKTTFIKLLMGIYNVPNNTIYYGNQEINSISLATLRNNISYIPQESEILNDTILENIKFGKANITNQQVMKICEQVNLHNKIINLEEGYNTTINERVNLSGGEQKRISIARGIIRDLPIIVMDEPWASLDSENANLIGNLITQLGKEKLILIITHQEIEGIRPDIRLVFDNGCLEQYEGDEQLVL